MGDHVETESAMTSQIPTPVHWCYAANFKLMVIKQAEEKLTSVLWHENLVSQN
jgi:hypothetical protein